MHLRWRNLEVFSETSTKSSCSSSESMKTGSRNLASSWTGSMSILSAQRSGLLLLGVSSSPLREIDLLMCLGPLADLLRDRCLDLLRLDLLRDLRYLSLGDLLRDRCLDLFRLDLLRDLWSLSVGGDLLRDSPVLAVAPLSFIW